jgi:hypothetical protein
MPVNEELAYRKSKRHSGSSSSKSLLDWIKGLHHESTNIHILVTSRPEQDIMARGHLLIYLLIY